MKTKTGFGIIEIILCLALIVMALFTLISVFSSSARHAVISRNRTVAILACQSTIDELKAHRFGTPAPKSWDEPKLAPVTIYLEGRPQELKFTRKLTFANGSFVGRGNGNLDEVTIEFEWSEGLGKNAGRKTLVTKVPVWR